MTTAGNTVSAEERFKWLRRHVLLWVIALLVLALVVIGSLFASGVFTTSSAISASVFTAGKLSISDSNMGAAILTAGPMVPGDTEMGTITITNTGDVDGHFSLEMTSLTDSTTGPGDLKLSDVLDLKIVQTGVTNPIFDDKLSAMDGATAIPLEPTNWMPNVPQTFTFTVTFPAGTADHDNHYQGTQAQAVFTWIATAGAAA